MSPDGRRAELDELLGAAIEDLHGLALAVEKAHFAHQGRLQQLVPIGDFQSLESV